MSKARRQIGWYNLAPIKKFGAGTNMIYGERSNGKTYSVKKEVIDLLSLSLEHQFIYLRRRKRQVVRRLMKKVFEDIDDYSEKTIGDYIKYSVDAGFYIIKDEVQHTIGYPMCVEDGTIGKGIPYPKVKTIMFEEFLEFDNSIEDEISKYFNIISTITRKREDATIYMTANTIGGGKLSPYFAAYGVDPKKIKPGQFAYIKHENGCTIAVHRTGSMNIGESLFKAKNKYVGVDNNPTVNMMLYGEWEHEICNIEGVDGITWNSERRLVPFYISAMGEVYELSIYENAMPILFVRKINTQDGKVRNEILFNLTYDGAVEMANKSGRVPMIYKANDIAGKTFMNWFSIVKKCVDSKRVVFDNMNNGSDFLKIFPYL